MSLLFNAYFHHLYIGAILNTHPICGALPFYTVPTEWLQKYLFLIIYPKFQK